jgi:L-asparaginase
MQTFSSRLVVLGTGGTMAGVADDAADNVGYRAATLGIDRLVAAAEVPAACGVETEQVAQLDSKDMDHATWQRLAQRVHAHLRRAEVRGLVVTHGTDTLEETAWFLQRVLAPDKPVVMTAAMRPATSRLSDGPQNLSHAMLVAAEPGAAGVVVAIAGGVWGADDVRKAHSYRLDAFDGGDAGPLARVEERRLRCLRPWPRGEALGLAAIDGDPAAWPWVEVVTSHAGADARQVDALVGAGVRGLVVAGTGSATVHESLVIALRRAAAQGVAVRRASRCAAGPVFEGGLAQWPALDIGPYKARVALMLELLAAA